MSTFVSALSVLEQERVRLINQLAAVANALAVLNGSTPSGAGRPRKLSAAARARIAAAQRARVGKGQRHEGRLDLLRKKEAQVVR